MGKGARNRAARRAGSDGLGDTLTASTPTIGVGRPSGRARAAMRAMWARGTDQAEERAVDPWQGYGNVITLGLSKVARWKNGRSRSDVAQMDNYVSHVRDSGQLKTLADVVQVADRERLTGDKVRPAGGGSVLGGSLVDVGATFS